MCFRLLPGPSASFLPSFPKPSAWIPPLDPPECSKRVVSRKKKEKTGLAAVGRGFTSKPAQKQRGRPSVGKCKKGQQDVGTVKVVSLSKHAVGMWTERSGKRQHWRLPRSRREYTATCIPHASIQSTHQREAYSQSEVGVVCAPAS